MGVLDEAKAQMRQGRAAAERTMAGRGLSADASIRMRLSVYWPAALLAILTAAGVWRLGHLRPLPALALGLAAGLAAALVLTVLLRTLLARAKAASGS